MAKAPSKSDLQSEVDSLTAKIYNADEECQWMREHLDSSKFKGPMNDYINVRDVDAFILRVKEFLS